MNENTIHQFVEYVIDNDYISAQDVSFLTQELFRDGLVSRDEADILIALDRAVCDHDPSWAAALVQLVSDFVVWTSRPTGLVDAETARWLTSSLACGRGPTDNAARIAFTVVCEAERVDAALVKLVLRMTRGRLDPEALPAARFRGALAA